jgi:hypothetical protein
VVPECRKDPRGAPQVAAKTGYVPYTMVVSPLVRDGQTIGVISLLDRRDGEPYQQLDLARAALFADLAVVALDLDTFPLSSTDGAHRLRARIEGGRKLRIDPDTYLAALRDWAAHGAASRFALSPDEAASASASSERGRAHRRARSRAAPTAPASFWDPPHGLTGMYHYWSFQGIDALVSAAWAAAP